MHKDHFRLSIMIYVDKLQKRQINDRYCYKLELVNTVMCKGSEHCCHMLMILVVKNWLLLARSTGVGPPEHSRPLRARKL